jgi:hypothetical protein
MGICSGIYRGGRLCDRPPPFGVVCAAGGQGPPPWRDHMWRTGSLVTMGVWECAMAGVLTWVSRGRK